MSSLAERNVLKPRDLVSCFAYHNFAYKAVLLVNTVLFVYFL